VSTPHATPEPAWLARLRTEVERSSQGAVARALRGDNGYPSSALISQVLAGRYQGRIDRLQALVEGHYFGAEVACPVLGAITRDRCVHEQRRPYQSHNPHRIACRRATGRCGGGCGTGRGGAARARSGRG